MRVTFLGVGAAFDAYEPNTSILVETDQLTMLLDCGASSGVNAWRYSEKALEIDAIYLSHFHGDHYFGLPAFLTRSVDEGRTKLLRIMGQAGLDERIEQLLTLAYPNVLRRASFPIEFVECSPDISGTINDAKVYFAQTDHSTDCLAIRIACGAHSVFYSGDGRITDAVEELAYGADLMIMESYGFETDIAGHGSFADSIAFAKKMRASKLACVHVNHEIRRLRREEIKAILSGTHGVDAFLPDCGDCITLT